MTKEAEGVVSVVVVTRNEARDIVRCLASIRAQSVSEIEIVVVDNASTDDTPALAASLADVVLDAGPERSAQRNAGARAATGSYLLFVDADMQLTERVVAECLGAVERGATAVVIPEMSVGDGLWTAAKALERSCYLGDATVEAPRFFLRGTFTRHGGYDEALTGPEDWDLPARMRSTETFGRTTAHIVHHEGRLTLRGLMQKKFYYGKSFGAYVRRHPNLARAQVLRPAFVREWRRLAATPGVALLMIVMKLLEYLSGAAGLAVAAVPRRNKAV